MKRVDIIISGGGMIGSIAAVAASRQGLSVLLIEAQAMSTIKQDSPRDLRVSAISADNINYLKELGIFTHLLQNRIQAYSKMHVWDNRGDGEITFEADYAQNDYLGYLMENNNLVQAAWNSLDDNCQTVQQTQIKTIENEGAQIRVELSNGDKYKSRLLIAAEGRNSFVRALAQIKTKETPYHQKGLVSYIKIENAPTQTALQAFNTGGPIGILPINEEEKIFSIVWSLPEQQADDWLQCEQQMFEQGVTKAIGKEFGKITLLSKRAAFPLTQLYAQEYFKKRIVLCGDSAHGVHPLAGQGVNLGIGDIQQLLKVINASMLKDDDLLHQALRKYQRRRISKVKETSEMMSILHHLFKDDEHVKKPLRNIGLKIVNNLPFKKWLAGQAGS
jgi:ubiquinone biosynthesis UbiH/UbiF/VisC/COQ6 family hydroxylase